MFKKLIKRVTGQAKVESHTAEPHIDKKAVLERKKQEQYRQQKAAGAQSPAERGPTERGPAERSPEQKGKPPQKKKPSGKKKTGTKKSSAKKQEAPWDLSQFQVPEVEGKTRFHDFNLPLPLMRAIHEAGFEYCTPIQSQSLEHTLHGLDLVGKAQTGTGKTAAFLISILTYLLEEDEPELRRNGTPRVLIIAPTRELVMQIAKDAHQLAKYTSFKVLTVVGGMDYQKQQKQLQKEWVDILVATPGRLLDFQNKRDLDLKEVEVLVLDEADRMLSMGFIPDVRRIIRATPAKAERQTFLFSATFTDEILRLSEQWTHEPVQVEIESERETTDTVEQKVYLVSDREKYPLLVNLLRQRHLERVIIFANRRDQTRRLAERLRKDGISVELLSGEVPQKKRISTLEAFRSGKLQALVATDVAGRGIHIDNVSHVINYALPEDPEDYVHRIGRTGRAGAEGISISFVGENDAFMLPEIETFIGGKLNCEQPEPDLLARF